MPIDGTAGPRSSLDPFLPPPPPQPGTPVRDESRDSLILRRVVARVIDWTVASLLVIVGWLVAAIFTAGSALWSEFFGTGDSSVGRLGQIMVAISFAVPFLWEFTWLALFGWTPGKRLLRLRVVSEPGPAGSSIPTKRLPMAAAARRSLIAIIVGLGFVDGPGLLRMALIAVYLVSMAASTNHRTFLDSFARTRVIRRPPR